LCGRGRCYESPLYWKKSPKRLVLVFCQRCGLMSRTYQGCSAAGTRKGGTVSPHFFRRGNTSPLPLHFFGLKFVQNLLHCCNWLLTETHTHTHLMALCPGLPGSASARKVKPIWILLKQETVSGSGISWAVCKSASSCRQITMPAPHHSFFYRPDALPAAQPTASRH